MIASRQRRRLAGPTANGRKIGGGGGRKGQEKGRPSSVACRTSGGEGKGVAWRLFCFGWEMDGRVLSATGLASATHSLPISNKCVKLAIYKSAIAAITGSLFTK